MEVQNILGNYSNTAISNTTNTVANRKNNSIFDKTDKKNYQAGKEIITINGKQYLKITYCIPKERHIGIAYVDIQTGKLTDTGLGIEKMGKMPETSTRGIE